jgi:hypothetical protein
VVVTARVDLDQLAEAELLPGTAAVMRRGGADSFVGVVFDDQSCVLGPASGDPLPWAGAAGELIAAVAQSGASLDDVVLVSGGRMWSYVCLEPECCPPQGRAIFTSSEIAATAAYAGLVALPDRSSVAALLEPAPDVERDPLLPLLERAEHEAVGRILRGADAREDRSVKRALFAAARAADAPGVTPLLGEDELVRFGLALQRIPTRDSVWMAVDDRRLDGRALWRQLARRLPAPYDAAPLFLFAWASWRDGDGALARMAADRALESDSNYSAADLLLAALSQAIDPRRMPRLRAAPKTSRRERTAREAG